MNWKVTVWNHVEKFRQQYNCSEIESLPIDAIHVAEVEVGLDLIPYGDLFTKHRVDAALTADFTGIYVDAEVYEEGDRSPMWKQNRLRFSVAHELGHFVLHRHLLAREGFSNIDQFIAWSQDLGGNKYQIEKEANEFAGRLLVPRDRLDAELATLADAARIIFPDWRHSIDFRNDSAERLGQRFGVCQKAMLARFSREELWPDPAL